MSNDFLNRLFWQRQGVEVRLIPAYYPFILDHMFDDSMQLQRRVLTSIMQRYFRHHLQRYQEDKKVGLDKLFQSILESGFENRDWPEGCFGIADLGKLEKALQEKSEAEISIGLTKATFKLRRFGKCLAVRPMSRQNNSDLHEESVRIFELMAKEDSYVRPFIAKIELTGNCFFPVTTCSGNRMILNMEDVKEKISKHIPSISWRGAKEIATKLAKEFVDRSFASDWVNTPVGSFFDLPVSAHISYIGQEGENGKNETWRHGVVEKIDDSNIHFRRADATSFRIVFVVETGSNQNIFVDEFDDNLDFAVEVELMLAAARNMYAGLVEIECQRAFAAQPYRTKILKKE